MKRLPQGWLLVLAISGWIVTFVVGISQDSAPFLGALQNSFSPWSLVCFAATWTWTNVMFLASFASLSGELGRVAAGGRRPNLESALARGFLIYLASVAGQIVLNGTLPASTREPGTPVLYVQQPQYFRVATFASLLAFMAGFNPAFFSSLVAKLEGIASQPEPPAC